MLQTHGKRQLINSIGHFYIITAKSHSRFQCFENQNHNKLSLDVMLRKWPFVMVEAPGEDFDGGSNWTVLTVNDDRKFECALNS